jgi:hypothetical protein
VDLTNVPGISALTAQTILCEIRMDVSRFRNASAFASWLGFCPEKKISGGKVLFTKSRRVRSRIAITCAWALNLYTTPKIIWENYSDVLPQAWQTSGNHSYCPQACSHRLSYVKHKGGLQRECL